MGYFSNYPKHVLLVLVNEFCERFSYYGMKVILVLYLTRALKYSDSTAVSIYHAFSAVCYFTPLFGAMIADGWLGKYRTILYVSMIYALGNISMAVTAIPYGGEYLSWGVFIGLVLIGLGSGGIKPCVSAFGGDQFKPDQARQKESFFSLFYMFINIGSLLTTLITPYIRSNVFCFDDNCYALAFGIPAILMVISIIIFFIGTPWYTKNPPGESILSRIFGCVGTALKGKLCGRKDGEKKDHWLDYAETKYDKQFISDVKDVFGVLWLFLPLPFFWAVYDQQGSRWTLQATQMDGDFGSFVMQPDMMGIMNSIMVVCMAPLLESVIYPVLNRLHIPNTPLQRMTWGMIFAASAFLLSGFIQIIVDDSIPPIPEAGESKLIFINSGPCKAHVHPLYSAEIEDFPLPQEEATDYFMVKADNYTFNLQWDCAMVANNFTVTLQEKKAYQIVLLGIYGNDDIQTLLQEEEQLEPTPNSASSFKFFNNLNDTVTLRVSPTKKQEKDQYYFNVTSKTFSERHQLVFATFDVYYTDETTNMTAKVKTQLNSKNGAIFTVLLSSGQQGVVDIKQLTDMGPRTVNIFLQVPQYLIMTIGECLFSITGLGFAYTQAPASMKSLLTAAWLLTVAVGNLIIIIIAETTSDSGNEAFICFLFSGLLYVVTVLFAIMSYFYKYVTPAEPDKKSISSSSSSSSSSSNSSSGNKDVEAFGEKPPLPDDAAEEKDKMDALDKKAAAESVAAMSAVGMSDGNTQLKDDGKNAYDNVAMDNSDCDESQF